MVLISIASGVQMIVNTQAVCQRMPSVSDSKDFYEFMETCQVAADMYSNKFTYTLINEEDLQKTLDINSHYIIYP